MKGHIRRLLELPGRYHLWGSLLIVVFICQVVGNQIRDRNHFASSELHRDVMDRWGAPITQAAPSLRYVPSGTIFNTLHPLPLESQEVEIEARMNYRKRGLVYFSGFEFGFGGRYVVRNTTGGTVDAVFVFPINLQKNKVLLSDLRFAVDGEESEISLAGTDKLVWTGRLAVDQVANFAVSFNGRGLDSFTYKLDPELPVRNFSLRVGIAGGANFDYANGVVPATSSRTRGEAVDLEWTFGSLESGIPVGVILPSEKSFDGLIATMISRAWVPFLLFFVSLSALARAGDRSLAFYECYLTAACYGFFFVLLAYLAAFMSFYVAYVLSHVIIGALLVGYARRLLPRGSGALLAGMIAAYLILPTLAVILEGYTGLIYCLEILALLAAAMVLTTRPGFGELMNQILQGTSTEAEVQHAG